MPSLQSVTVRHAIDADQDAARRVSERAFQTVRHVYRPKQDVAQLQRQRWNEGMRLVAVVAGTIVGTVQYRLDERHVHLVGLAVDPEYRGRGIGRRLVEHVASLAPGLGHGTIAADTIRETGAVAFFERLGFHVVRETVATWCESDAFPELHCVDLERRTAGSDGVSTAGPTD